MSCKRKGFAFFCKKIKIKKNKKCPKMSLLLIEPFRWKFHTRQWPQEQPSDVNYRKLVPFAIFLVCVHRRLLPAAELSRLAAAAACGDGGGTAASVVLRPRSFTWRAWHSSVAVWTAAAAAAAAAPPSRACLNERPARPYRSHLSAGISNLSSLQSGNFRLNDSARRQIQISRMFALRPMRHALL